MNFIIKDGIVAQSMQMSEIYNTTVPVYCIMDKSVLSLFAPKRHTLFLNYHYSKEEFT